MERLKFWRYLSSSSPSMTTNDIEQEDYQGFPAAENKQRYAGWKCMPYIIGNEACERVATTGLLANLTVYFVKKYNMEMVTAANAITIFAGTANFAPLMGSFISDCYWGRYRTLAFSSIATFLGMLVMTMTAAIPVLRPPSCGEMASGLQVLHCKGPSVPQISVLLLSIALLTLGSAGIRPCGMPFGVDQFDRSTDQGRLELSSFFNWYYCIATAAMMVAMTVVVYIQDCISWTIGFGIPAVLMLCAIGCFFFGSNLYVHVPPKGTNPFSSTAQVIVAAFRKRRLHVPFPCNSGLQESLLYNNSPLAGDDNDHYLPLTLQLGCLNKAGIICNGELRENGTAASPWRLCTVQQIEEVKCLIRIVPIWAASIVCFVAIVQQGSFTVLQALVMDRRMGSNFEVPAGSLIVTSIFVLTVFMPLYDRLLVPFARRFTGISTGITLLQRQGIGMVVAVASMIVAGIVEQRRRKMASSQMSVIWLLPQLGLMGLAEALNAVGQVEFYNHEFPEHMRTQATALFSCSVASASYASSALVGLVRGYTGWLDDNIDAGRVDYYYYLIASMGVVNLLYFVICAHFYRYKGVVYEVAEKGSESSACKDNTSQEFLEERLPLLA